ncbi:MAG: SIS domain-containing protein [Clostridia bacterium]|nr:SIS domain-containing protein [Clostridia bacterium]
MVDKIFDTLFERYPSLKVIRDELYTAYELMCDCYDAYGKILICGNGGSSADADHIVGELMKGFNLKRPLSDDDIEFFDGIEGGTDIAKKLQGGLPAISLSAHSALMTAFCNDVDPDLVFAQQVWAYSKNSPDLLIALSTSGNSTNVVNAVKTANAVGIDSIGITGKNGGKLLDCCTLCIRLPETDVYKVQELTLPVYHALCAAIETRFFK